MVTGSRSRGWRFLKTAAVVLLAIGCGAAGAIATEHYRDGWRSDLLQARAETKLELASYRLDSFQEMLTLEEELAAHEETRHFEIVYVRRQLHEIEHEHRVARLELEEIELSGQKPDRSLYAGRVGGRDFVSEYLNEDQETVLGQLEFLIAYRDRLANQSGAADAEELSMLGNQIVQTEIRIQGIEEKLVLRARFLNGKLDAHAAQIEEELNRAQERHEESKRTLVVLAAELEKVKRRAGTGSTPDYEVRSLQRALVEREAQLRLAEREVEILKRARGLTE